MSINVLKIGILGTANIAKRSIMPAILKLPNQYKLIGIASRDYTKALQVSSDFNIRPFESYDKLLGSGLIDVVYLPLPNALHYKWVKIALEKGLHVLVEKSLGCNFREVTELNDLAKQQGLVLVENFQFRFHQQLDYIQRRVEDGTIGELRSIRSSFGFPPFKDADNIRYDASLGGGALLDAGAYPVKLVQIFMKGDLEVAAATLFNDTDKKVDIGGGAFIKQLDGNLFCQIAFGFDHYYQCNLELWGSKGKISTNRIFTAPPDHKPEILIETNDGLEKVILEKDNHFKNMLGHFHQLCTGKRDKNNEYIHNINQARLIEQLKNKANE